MIRVPIKPTLLRWARERAGLDQSDLATKFPKLSEWEAGTLQPTLKQVERFANAVHVSVGYLYLSNPPPAEQLPIADFRTIGNKSALRPSPNLLDVLYSCQERQDWYRDFARLQLEDELSFVGSADGADSPVEVASNMCDEIGFTVEVRQDSKTWSEALRQFIRSAGEAGILVMTSGIVGSNTHRTLDPNEFRGFALSDAYAPLVFINGADSKAAQMFTLAHELAHLWLGSSALSNCEAAQISGLQTDEAWCNAVAAEFLVPTDVLRRNLRKEEELAVTLRRLSPVFKVSSLVLLRRLLDVGWLQKAEFARAWVTEKRRLSALFQQRGSGGDFYRTTISRVGRRFANALITSTLEGQTLYRDAFRMLGIRKHKTFEELMRQLSEPS